jgi:type I restriction enzyme S subunit
MTALLTANLPLLAGAPNGIKKLRGLILELAVRGKLVLQDPNDEPASELLKRIAEEKAQLVADGQIKKQKSLSEMAEKKQFFELPAGWEWASTAKLTLLITDGTHHTPTYISSGIPFISVKDINGKTISFDNCKYISQEEHIAINSRCNPEQGDILLCRIGTLGRPTIVDTNIPFSLFVSVGLLKLPKKTNFSRYFHCALSSPLMYRQYDQIKAGGSHTNKLNLGDIPRLFVPVPPLNEQHRIVAKVDELMALCDRLDAKQADAESAHTQLVQALLDSLIQASDATGFATNWQLLAEHFHSLFTTEHSIDAFKQTLLQLAVAGKLVPQDTSEESANELLKRIAEEKEQLIAKGKIRKPKQRSEINDEDKAIILPKGWEAVRFGQIIDLISGQHLGPDEYFENARAGAIPYLTGPADFGETYPRPTRFTIERRATSAKGDILLTVKGSGVGKTNFVDQDEIAISRQLMAIRPIIVDQQFVRNMLLSMSAHFQSKSIGIAIPGISREDVIDTLVGLPPLAEQHRIVAKVDQLMALCDRLKTRLAQARQLNEQLASTLIERALSEEKQQAPVTTDRQTARTLLAAEVTHRLHSQRTFGQRKLQKVIYLAEHTARLTAVQGDYLRDAAGPHDRQLMNKVEGELQNHQWYERIERETVGYAYRPLSQAGQHRQAYSSAWSVAERVTIEQVIELMRDWDTDRCEMTVTLYAAWNDFILEGRPVSDDAIVDEVMHSWNDTKLRFGKTEWLAVLAEMKKHKILMPTGFGKRTKGGMLSLPGFE